MEGTISLKDHMHQLGEAKDRADTLANELESIKTQHQEAVERVQKLTAELTGTQQQLTDARAEHEADKTRFEGELKQRDASLIEDVKKGVIEALSNQGLDPVTLQTKPSKTVYKAEDVANMSPQDRAQVMRDRRAGKAVIE
tara:strand:- start:1764 stop:2186 length:423 start_codon:yes stop_codon:yes gene_type:complete